VPTTFTIEEARELVPWLQDTFDALQPLIGKLDNLAHAVNRKSLQMRSDGGAEVEEESSEARNAHREVESEIRLLVDSIIKRGVLVKDVRRGLFDFPYLRDGNLVNLCWLAGEPDLMYWHTDDSGFAGRQPL
jgi:hypothetical protein